MHDVRDAGTQQCRTASAARGTTFLLLAECAHCACTCDTPQTNGMQAAPAVQALGSSEHALHGGGAEPEAVVPRRKEAVG